MERLVSALCSSSLSWQTEDEQSESGDTLESSDPQLPNQEANCELWKKNPAMVSTAHGSWSQEATQSRP